MIQVSLNVKIVHSWNNESSFYNHDNCQCNFFTTFQSFNNFIRQCFFLVTFLNCSICWWKNLVDYYDCLNGYNTLENYVSNHYIQCKKHGRNHGNNGNFHNGQNVTVALQINQRIEYYLSNVSVNWSNVTSTCHNNTDNVHRSLRSLIIYSLDFNCCLYNVNILDFSNCHYNNLHFCLVLTPEPL